jgi:hypothetical protein
MEQKQKINYGKYRHLKSHSYNKNKIKNILLNEKYFPDSNLPILTARRAIVNQTFLD